MTEPRDCSTGFDVVIVGAGMGGAQAAIALRRHGFAGSIGVLGDEPDLPYDRPALSKGYLEGTDDRRKILTRPEELWSAQDVTMLLEQEAVAVDPHARKVMTRSGHGIGYEHLVWAAGGRARRLPLPGAESKGVHYIRTRADVDALHVELAAATRAVVIGGGYIGLEAAAALRKRHIEVTILEMAQRLLARVTGDQIAAFFDQEHRRHGVDVRTATAPHKVLHRDGSVVGVELADGTQLPCDLVVVGIGIEPAVGPLVEAGAACSNGVEVDEGCRTSIPGIYAIGDCALHRQEYASGELMRLESVQNAHAQADVAARNITGQDARYQDVPWFWSHQYDVRLQTAGIVPGHDSAEITGAPETGSFTVHYFRDGALVAADCVNSPRDYMAARKRLAAQHTACREG